MARKLELTHGRRWALALGLPFVLGSIGYGSLTYVAYAGQDSYRLQPALAPAGAQVSIGVGDGNITIGPSSDGQAHLRGTIHYSLFRPTVTWQTTSAGTELHGLHCLWVGNCGATLSVSVPPARAVKASSGSGNITAHDLAGTLTLHDDSGNIKIDGASGASLHIDDSSGNISTADLTSRQVQGHDDSGNVSLSFRQPPDQVTISDSSGNITVAVPAGTAYRVVTHASSGSTHVEVATDPASPHLIDLRADSGNVKIVLTS